MARFLICTMPITGHVNPGLPITRSLVARGHEVWWYTGQKFRARVEAAGAHFAPMRAAHDFDDSAMATVFPGAETRRGLAGFSWGVKHIFLDPVPGQIADLRAILAEFPADVLLCDTTFIGANYLHELGGPVWATFGITVLTLGSADTAPFGTQLPPSSSPLGRLRNRALNVLFSRVLLRDVGVHANQIRRRLELPPTSDYVLDGISPYLYLHSSTPDFEYPRGDLPEQVHFIGPLLPEPAGTDSLPGWWDELGQGRPVVLVTQGTIANAAPDLIAPVIQALSDEPALVLVTTGGRSAAELGLEPLPANVRVEPFVSYGALMPHVTLMITNGGFGGVQFALAHGVPLIVAGATEDKPEIAARVAWSGAGINLKTGTPSVETVRVAVRHLLEDPRYRLNAERIGREFALHDAPAEATSLLEALAESRRPILRTPATPDPVRAPVGYDEAFVHAAMLHRR